MEFDRSPLSHERWRDLLRESARANLLQSWPYAVAARLQDQMMSRRGLIMEAGRMIGFMQIQEIKLGPIHVVKLYRGPLWLKAGPPGPLAGVPRRFQSSLPPRLGRWRRALFELDRHHRLLRQAVTGLKEDGALNFDLGGVNPRRAEGVTTFKAASAPATSC